MLLEFLVWLVNLLLNGISAILPGYSNLPLPDWLITSIATTFSYMKLILELPIIRKLYEYFLIWLPIWFIIWQWNLVLKIVGLVPGLGGLTKFRLKDNDGK